MRKGTILCGLAAGLLAMGCYQTTSIVLPDGFVVQARIADTPKKAEKGLMFVKQLPPDQGMLFVFDGEEERFFWMKNTWVDLDILFLDEQGKINQLHQRVPRTYAYTPRAEIPVVRGEGKYVVELAAGTAQRHGLKLADKLVLNYEKK